VVSFTPSRKVLNAALKEAKIFSFNWLHGAGSISEQLNVAHLVWKFLSAHETNVYGWFYKSIPTATIRNHAKSNLTVPFFNDHPSSILRKFCIYLSVSYARTIPRVSVQWVTHRITQITTCFQKSSFFWNITQTKLAVSYRRFRKPYRSHFQRSSSDRLSRIFSN
jgi:hypothetical protein